MSDSSFTSCNKVGVQTNLFKISNKRSGYSGSHWKLILAKLYFRSFVFVSLPASGRCLHSKKNDFLYEMRKCIFFI